MSNEKLLYCLTIKALFIATSDGTEEGIDNRSGGLCYTRHMKIKFEIHSGNLFFFKSF